MPLLKLIAFTLLNLAELLRAFRVLWYTLQKVRAAA